MFAEHIDRFGLERTSLDLGGRPRWPVPVFNHPPPAALCWEIAEATGARFAIVLKSAGSSPS
ncbi:MAG: hypothetical protein INH37_18695 [Myxococcaceae bacterium]|nr:hypothetical protein [Myxococcaceae bacterium]